MERAAIIFMIVARVHAQLTYTDCSQANASGYYDFITNEFSVTTGNALPKS